VSGVSVFELLDREWGRLGADARAAPRLEDVCRRAGGARSLAEVERFVRDASPPEADAVLVALAARAVEDDGLAARVLLQLLMPGVRRLARTWWALGDADERAAAAVAAVYDRIRRYPLARRPRRIAANVLMDAAADLRRAVRSAGAATGVPAVDGWAAAEPVAVEPVHPAVELAEVLAEAVRGGLVSAADAELIAASRIAGVPLADIAERRGAKLRTLQWRRRRAEETLSASGSLVAA
jgi:DNA-directed RNA polymerase specialized sigma24 family protein